ncbi:MAG TPA: SHOCT domain-containing protein [Nitrosopumilaceae archaeon]|nr:SHOCT domain-containing protein [Nitrosopumilaceae archaeon]
MSEFPVDVQASHSFATASAEMNSGFDHMRLQLTSLEKYMQMGSISMGLVGIGLVTFGGLIKNGTKFKTNDTPIEILKKRLVKGEITKIEFDNLKQNIQ